MSELTSKFNRSDIETLIQSVDDWEALGNSEFHIMQMFKNVPMPEEDHEGYSSLHQIKEHFRNKEKSIMASRLIRQEKATFIKAKLMLLRQDMAANKVFDFSPEVETNEESGSVQNVNLAETFIKDLGVWEHYQKFLEESKNS